MAKHGAWRTQAGHCGGAEYIQEMEHHRDDSWADRLGRFRTRVVCNSSHEIVSREGGREGGRFLPRNSLKREGGREGGRWKLGFRLAGFESAQVGKVLPNLAADQVGKNSTWARPKFGKFLLLDFIWYFRSLQKANFLKDTIP